MDSRQSATRPPHTFCQIAVPLFPRKSRTKKIVCNPDMKPVPLMAREEWAINDGSVPLRVPASAVRQNAAPGGCWHVEIIPLIPGTAVHNASEDSWEKKKRRKEKEEVKNGPD